jgi:hypothetical protein
MPSNTAAPSSSSMSLVVRLVPGDADEVELCVFTGAVVTSGLGEARASIGDGDAVDGGLGDSLGAGMTVTTGFGDGERRARLGVGDGCAWVGLGLGAAERLGVGNGGITPVGELDGSARWVLLGDGLGVLGRALAVAFGDGDGDGAADAAVPSRTTGVSTPAASASSSGRRTSGTH